MERKLMFFEIWNLDVEPKFCNRRDGARDEDDSGMVKLMVLVVVHLFLVGFPFLIRIRILPDMHQLFSLIANTLLEASTYCQQLLMIYENHQVLTFISWRHTCRRLEITSFFLKFSYLCIFLKGLDILKMSRKSMYHWCLKNVKKIENWPTSIFW